MRTQLRNPFEIRTDRISRAIWKAVTIVFREMSREAFDALGERALGPRAPTGERTVFGHVAKFTEAAEAIMNLVDDLARDEARDQEMKRPIGKDYNNEYHIELQAIRKELIISQLALACLADQAQRSAVRQEIEPL